MNINTYNSFEEAMELRYGATQEEISAILKVVPNVSKDWALKGRERLTNIDLALYFGVPFEEIADNPWFVADKPKVVFSKCKLAVLANPDLENFGIDANYLSLNLSLENITCTMEAILQGDLPHGYDIFESSFATARFIGITSEQFHQKYHINNQISYINKQFQTYFSDFYEELMQEFPFFVVTPNSSKSAKPAQTVSIPRVIEDTMYYDEPKKNFGPSLTEIERKKAFKNKLKALWAEPTRPRRGKVSLPITSVNDICYTTDKELYYDKIKYRNQEQIENAEDLGEEQETPLEADTNTSIETDTANFAQELSREEKDFPISPPNASRPISFISDEVYEEASEEELSNSSINALSKEQIDNLSSKFAEMYGVSVADITDRLEFLKREFLISDSLFFSRIELSNQLLLGTEKNYITAKEKLSELLEEPKYIYRFLFIDKEINFPFLDFPAINADIQYFTSLGVSKLLLAKNPKFLVDTSSRDLLLKLCFAYQIPLDEIIESSSKGAHELYARMKGLESIRKPNGIFLTSEHIFQTLYGLNTSDLMEKYPLDQVATLEINKLYQKAVQNGYSWTFRGSLDKFASISELLNAKFDFNDPNDQLGHSVKKKVEFLMSLGIKAEELDIKSGIFNNSTIRLNYRTKLAFIFDVPLDRFLSSYYKRTEQSIWARYMAYNDDVVSENIPLYQIPVSKYELITGLQIQDLIKKYPFNDEVKKLIDEQYKLLVSQGKEWNRTKTIIENKDEESGVETKINPEFISNLDYNNAQAFANQYGVSVEFVMSRFNVLEQKFGVTPEFFVSNLERGNSILQGANEDIVSTAGKLTSLLGTPQYLYRLLFGTELLNFLNMNFDKTKENFNFLRNIGIHQNQIAKNPKLLLDNSILVLKMGLICSVPLDVLLSRSYKNPARIYWARMQAELHNEIPSACVFTSERLFHEHTGRSTSEFVEKYPLDSQAIQQIEESYQTIVSSGKTFDTLRSTNQWISQEKIINEALSPYTKEGRIRAKIMEKLNLLLSLGIKLEEIDLSSKIFTCSKEALERKTKLAFIYNQPLQDFLSTGYHNNEAAIYARFKASEEEIVTFDTSRIYQMPNDEFQNVSSIKIEELVKLYPMTPDVCAWINSEYIRLVENGQTWKRETNSLTSQIESSKRISEEDLSLTIQDEEDNNKQ